MTLAPSFAPAAAASVRQVLTHPELSPILRLAAGSEGLDRPVNHPRIQKSGLALVGHRHGIDPTRIQVLGETEISFLESLAPGPRAASIDAFFSMKHSCVVVTRGIEPLPELAAAATATETPVVVSLLKSSRTINALHHVLDRMLAPTTTEHGVLVDIFGLGTLLLGPSGIGKSECALFLLERGHRLVADDRVQLTLLPSGSILGAPLPLLRHHVEVRGIGIINVPDLFGAASIRDEAHVELIVELCHWRDDEPYERLGIDDQTRSVLGMNVPFLKIPVRAGRNMGVILEVAARNQLLKRTGRHGAREFTKNLADSLGLARPILPKDPGDP